MPAVTAMSFKCPACGALLVPDGSPTVRCAYCGAVSQVAPQQAPPAFAPPPAYVPVDATGTKLRTSSSIGCIAAIPVLLAVVGGLVALLAKGGGFDASYTGAMGGPPCAVDANGDGAPDPIGFVSAGKSFALTAFDAKTGKRLWTGDSLQNAQVWCADAAAVMVTSSSTFDVARYDPRTGAKLWGATLHDHVMDVAGGSGCVAFTVADGSTSALDTATGKPLAKCAATSDAKGDSEKAAMALTALGGGDPPKVEVMGPMLAYGPHQDEARGLEVGDVRVLFGSMSGTPRFLLAAWPKSAFPPLVAADGSHPPFWDTVPKSDPRWTRVVDVERSGSGQYDVARLGDSIFVAGKKPGDARGIAYALVRPTGEVVYTKWIEGKDDNVVFWSMSSGGGRAFLHWEWSLTAVDIASGNILWTSGTSRIASTSP